MEDPSDPTEDTEPVEIPPAMLSVEAVRGIAEAFVLREGTDYGAREFTHEEKVDQVLAALGRNEALILFDPRTDSVTLRLRGQRAT
jgi:uncharacterized protein YheU (UPF0270 family)